MSAFDKLGLVPGITYAVKSRNSDYTSPDPMVYVGMAPGEKRARGYFGRDSFDAQHPRPVFAFVNYRGGTDWRPCQIRVGTQVVGTWDEYVVARDAQKKRDADLVARREARSLQVKEAMALVGVTGDYLNGNVTISATEFLDLVDRFTAQGEALKLAEVVASHAMEERS